MAYNFLRGDRDQAFLLPSDLRGWLPADHLAWFVLDVVDQLDLASTRFSPPTAPTGTATPPTTPRPCSGCCCTRTSLFHKPVRADGEAAAWGAARDAAVPRCSWDAFTEGRSHSATLTGSMVWSTTASSSAESSSRLISSRRRVLNASMVL